jgi:hypothetical protein
MQVPKQQIYGVQVSKGAGFVFVLEYLVLLDFSIGLMQDGLWFPKGNGGA